MTLEFKSTHDPEQQAGVVPVQGAAVQDPQWATLELRSAHEPEQQAGVVPSHCHLEHNKSVTV